MSGYDIVQLGLDANGSGLFFSATNIAAKKMPGTVKQLIGKKMIQREIVARDILDWNIIIDGVFEGSTSDILETFKEAMFANKAKKLFYKDNADTHTGSYLMLTDGLVFIEPPEDYDNGIVRFRVQIAELNQEGGV